MTNKLNPARESEAGQIKHVDAGTITLYEAVVFLLALCLGLGKLYFVSSSNVLSTTVSFASTALDALLAIVVISKLGATSGILAILSIGVVGAVSAYCTSSLLVLKSLLLIVGAKNENILRVFRTCAVAYLMTLVLGCLTSILGLASAETFRRGGMALGFVHPNQASLLAAVSLMMFAVSGTKSSRDSKLSAKEFALATVLVVFILLTGSRTALLALGVGIFFTIISSTASKNGSAKVLRLLTGLFAPALFLFSLVTAATLYSSPFAQWLDNVFVTRIWLNWFALSNFDITLFGQEINLHITGVHNTLLDTWNVTTTVDCTYIAGLLVYGIVVFFIWVVASCLSTEAAWRSRNFVMVGSSVALAFYAFTESQLMDPLLYFTFLNICVGWKAHAGAVVSCGGDSRLLAVQARRPTRWRCDREVAPIKRRALHGDAALFRRSARPNNGCGR